MEQLKTLLRAKPLELFPDDEDGGKQGRNYGQSAKLYTKSELDQLIQCSRSELEAALVKVEAFDYRGHLRVLSQAAEHAIAKNLALTINAEGWPLDRLEKTDVLAKSLETPVADAALVEFVLDLYLQPATNDQTMQGSSSICTFNIPRYNALSARQLLTEKPSWLLSEFLNIWRDSVPDNFPIDASQLDGLICHEEYGADAKITFLPSYTMSHNPKTRLAELFKAKPKWTFAQLKPYLQDLVTSDTNEEQLLVAFTRSSTGPGGQKLYSAR